MLRPEDKRTKIQIVYGILSAYCLVIWWFLEDSWQQIHPTFRYLIVALGAILFYRLLLKSP